MLMKKAGMLAKISLKYWLHHKRRLFTLMLALVLGVSALCCTALLVRSEKDAVLESELYLLGDYDMQILDATEDTVEIISKEKDVNDFAVQYQLGSVKSSTGASAFCAAFKDQHSVDIYHMTCERGRYPEKEDEVTMDIGTAKQLGVKPYPGEKITLELYSPDEKKLAEKEYTLCGVYDGANKDSEQFPWYRYPYILGENEYNMPSVYFHISQNEIFKSNNITAFIQTDVDDPYTVYQSIAGKSKDSLQLSIENGRRYSYSYVMGNEDILYDESKYDRFTLNNIDMSIKNGDTVKDFYSQILMPILTGIIFVIVILSVVGLTRNIIKDRQENFAVLRSLGLEQKHLTLYIFCDFTLTSLVCIGIGLALGSLAHIGLVNALNKLYDLKLHYGFNCIKYVNAVTFDPFILSLVVTLICVELSVFIAIISFIGKSPVQMFVQSKAKRRIWHRAKPAGRYRSWRFLLIRRIKLRNVRIAVVSILVMSVALTGYAFFNALARKENNDLKWQKENAGLGYWDYNLQTAANNKYLFNIENHHENGVKTSDYDTLKSNDAVEDVFARSVVGSTRLNFAQDSFDDKTKNDLKKFELKKFGDIDPENAHEFDIAQKESEEAMIEKIGYKKTDLIYSCPTVGLYDNILDELEPFVIDGKIDKEKLKDGSEVLLVMDITGKIKFENTFKAGDKLPLSDIVLNEKEEQLDFNSLDPAQLGEPAYQKKVKNHIGEETEERSYAIGKRKDIDVKIGAVLILDLEVANKYMTNAVEGDHGLNVFCTPGSFKKWGVGERNLTEVSMKMKSGASIGDADDAWYTLISHSKGVSSRSTTEITAGMNKGTRKVMCIYYSMIIILTLTAAVMIAISLYTDIRMRSGKFAMLRACGMSVRQILFMIWRQNVIYPIVGIACAFVPLMLTNKLFLFINDKVVKGEWTSSPERFAVIEGQKSVPWIDMIPYYQKLYDCNIKGAVIVILAAYFALILLVTLPQIRFIRRQPIVEEIEKSSF